MCRQPQTDLATGFESKTCGRCGGSGRYSYCQMYGDTCFSCRGAGIVLTKRGAAAYAYYQAMYQVPAGSIMVGDWVALSWSKKPAKVTSVGESSSKYLKDGEWLPHWEITTTRGSLGTFADAMIKKCETAEIVAERKAAAYAYQQTLGVNGKPTKRRQTANA